MKFKIIFLVLFISMLTSAQIENLSKFRTDKYEDDLTIFKIKGKKYKTDFKKRFVTDNSIIFENKSDDIIHFMIFDKKYLFVGYFNNTIHQQMQSRVYEFRDLDKLIVVDLDTPSNKWTYQFNGKTTMGHITSFDPKDGDIIYNTHVKPLQDK